jgi:hypothetical protein
VNNKELTMKRIARKAETLSLMADGLSKHAKENDGLLSIEFMIKNIESEVKALKGIIKNCEDY